MRKLILMALLAVVSSSAMATDDLYQEYKCETENDMNSCANSCTANGVVLGFKVNPQNATVLMNYYSNGVVQNSFALETCKVADADNWICTHSLLGKIYNGRYYRRAAGGIVVDSFVVRNNIDWSIYNSSYFCAKKKG